MKEEFSYKCILKPSSGTYKDKGSKFLAFAYPVQSVENVKLYLDELKKQFHDARHHCYAYRIGVNEIEYRQNDDGEPSGTAGKPIYGQILSFGITNVLIVVVRYFGGTKLGVRGLIDAYKGAAMDALQNADISICFDYEYYILEFGYNNMSDVMRILKDDRITQMNNVFEMHCVLEIAIRKDAVVEIVDNLTAIQNLKITLKDEIKNTF